MDNSLILLGTLQVVHRGVMTRTGAYEASSIQEVQGTEKCGIPASGVS